MELSLIAKLVLPVELLDHFEVSSYRELGDVQTKTLFYEIDLAEKNIIPAGYNVVDYESKGYSSSSRIQDFPIRGKALYLNIKKRRWRSKTNKKEIIKNDFSFISRGAKLTRELSDFLKSTGQYKGRYD